jgi:kumamolisin
MPSADDTPKQRPTSAARPTRYVPIHGSELAHLAGARSIPGRLNLNEVAEVALFVRGAAAGDDLQADVHNLGSARVRERQYLSRRSLSDKYGADSADLAAIASFANGAGLTIEAISPAHRMVRLAGPLGSLAQAFNVQFSLYQSPQGSYRGYTGAVHVPDTISSIVKGVFGLDNKPQSTYHLRKLPSKQPFQRRGPYGAAAAAATQSYAPNEVASLYNFPTDVDGTGVCIGILEFGGGFNPSDLNTYFQSLGIATPQVAAVSVGRAVNRPIPGPNSPDDEVMLDIEVVGAIAPAAQIVVYFAPNTNLGWWLAINTAINDSYHNPSVISISWGGPENSWSPAVIDAINYEFQAAGTLGITICTAAGDSGFTDGGIPASQAHVDFPASSPYVLSCGGTRLHSSGGKVVAESVWNDLPTNGATGGGVSAVFPVPSYQTSANVPPSVNPPGAMGRGVPDVAGDADPNTGYRIRVHGQEAVIGGTSAVAPLWAALCALINQKLGSPVGFMNSLLYSQGLAGKGFTDIVKGDNGSGGYVAGPGWDACTGLGTPDGTALSVLL